MLLNNNQIAGKQLAGNNTNQKALQNITNSQNQFQFTHNQFGNQAANIKPPSQKQVSFGGDQISKINFEKSSNDVSFVSNNVSNNQQNEPFFGISKQDYVNTQNNLNLNNNNDSNRNQEQKVQTNFQQGNGEKLKDLVHQSDQTLRQLEDQFKSLNIGGANTSSKMVNFDSNLSSNNYQKSFPMQGESNIKSLISDIDKIIQQAQNQTKQLTPNDDGGFKIQNPYGYNSNQFDERGRVQASVDKRKSSSPSKNKHRNKKKHRSKSQRKKSKKSKKRDQSFSDDDTSSYSGESDSVIQEQNESYQDESSYEENYDDDHYENGNYNSKNKYQKSKRNQANNNQKKRRSSENRNEINDAKSLSNYSRARSINSRANQNQMNQGASVLQKSQLKNLPNMNGGMRFEPSVQSSASKQKLQINYQSQIGGFRRCHDESMDNIKNTDDSFDINDDFNIKDHNQSSNKKNNNYNSNNYNFKKKKQNNDNQYEDYEGQNRRNYQDFSPNNQDDQYLMQRYQSHKELSVQSNLQSRIQSQKQQLQQMQVAADEDLVFCINCEEYIKADKVDEHSNVCEASRNDYRNLSKSQILQKINEKLIKIRYLVKNKSSHIVNLPSLNIQQQGLIQLYDQILDILSVCIENNQEKQTLQEAEFDIKNINLQLMRNTHSSSLYLLYLTQKVIEFVQRKYEFIDKYGNYNEFNENYQQQYQTNNYQLQQQRDLNNFSNNLDAISIASSNFNNRQNMNQNNNPQYQTNQKAIAFNTKARDPIKIFSKIEEDLQVLNPNHNIQQQQNQIKSNNGLPPRQPNSQIQAANQRNNIFTQAQSPNKQLFQSNTRDIYQSPQTRYQQNQNVNQISPAQSGQQQPPFQQQQIFQQNNLNQQKNSNFSLKQSDSQQAQRIQNNQNQVQPFQFTPQNEEQKVFSQQNHVKKLNTGNSLTNLHEDAQSLNQQQKQKKKIFSDAQQQQAPISVMHGRQLTSQSEKSQDTFEYSYKNQTARWQKPQQQQQQQQQQHQIQQYQLQQQQQQQQQIQIQQQNQIQFQPNQIFSSNLNNSNFGVYQSQPVLNIKESYQGNFQTNMIQNSNQNLNSNINIQVQQDKGSPYKVESPYKVQPNYEDKNYTVAQKQKFFVLAIQLKKSYPHSQIFLIADLWQEAIQLKLQEIDWEKFIIQKFQQ
ncbi:hypothetical protein ABPG72_008375 [Tetrahymena utriculariae]